MGGGGAHNFRRHFPPGKHFPPPVLGFYPYFGFHFVFGFSICIVEGGLFRGYHVVPSAPQVIFCTIFFVRTYGATH